MSSDDNEERVLKRLTVRELRERAVKSLGSKVAAGLKLKDELIDALAKKASKAAAPVKKAAAAAAKGAKAMTSAKAAKATPPKAAPAKTPPKPKKVAAPKASAPRASAPRASAPKKSAPAKKTNGKNEKAVAKAPRLDKPSKAEAVAQVYELPITRDFFVDPRRPSLPTSYGDDRLLCFRREPLAIVVSWDLSAATFADGQGIALELVTQKGKLAGSVPVNAPTGLATFDQLPEGTALTVQVVRKGRVMTRGRPFMLGPVRDEDAASGGGEPWKMTVSPDEPLEESPEREPWGDAPAGSRAKGRRASSSRLSS